MCVGKCVPRIRVKTTYDIPVESEENNNSLQTDAASMYGTVAKETLSRCHSKVAPNTDNFLVNDHHSTVASNSEKFLVNDRLNLPRDFPYLQYGHNFRVMKRSFSFSGFDAFSSEFSDMSSQEIEAMFDPVSKKEPSSISKKQIEEYGVKYKHLKEEKHGTLPWYRSIFEYTQPAHMIACVAFVYLAYRLFPDPRRSQPDSSVLSRLFYVSSISAAFGTQFWMTFVSGLALFFGIARHMFAKVQTVLFPLYFLTNACLMMVAIIAFTQHYPTHLWDNQQFIQGGILVLGFIINLGIRLYMAPKLTKLITIKVAIENEAGLGNEVGSSRPGVLSRCPQYMRLYKAFRKTHFIIAIGNMASMGVTAVHMYFVAVKLCAVDL